jgi:DNA-binding MarR family transcriptional regulator
MKSTLSDIIKMLKAESRWDHVSFAVLVILENAHSGVTMTALSDLCGHSSAATTGSIDSMERSGLISRYYDPADRRKILIQRTA